jgi:recombinational DNA repair protein (RecF pathway)
MKKCCKCGEIKEDRAFHRDAHIKSGLSSRCRECKNEYERSLYHKNPQKQIDRKKGWNVANRDRRRAIRRKHLYGISSSEYDGLLIAQCRQCAICGRPLDEKNIHVDHDHVSYKVRGILCGCCNRGLGQFKDSPMFLQAAANYLRAHSDV